MDRTHTCTVDDVVGHSHTLRFNGTLDGAQRYFHGQIGPKYPVLFNNQRGVFTVRDETQGPTFLPDRLALN